MIAEKATLDKTKKEAEEKAIQVENERDRKIRTIGNYVHDSVPVSQTEVRSRRKGDKRGQKKTKANDCLIARMTTQSRRPGSPRTLLWTDPIVFPTTRS